MQRVQQVINSSKWISDSQRRVMPRDTDPKSLGDRPHLGAPVSHSAANPEQAPVPAPTTTAPSQPLPPSGDASGSNLKAMSTAEVTAVPLFGATPPPDPAAKAADGKERIAAGSKERVASLRRAREAELERSGSNVAAAQAGVSLLRKIYILDTMARSYSSPPTSSLRRHRHSSPASPTRQCRPARPPSSRTSAASV